MNTQAHQVLTSGTTLQTSAVRTSPKAPDVSAGGDLEKYTVFITLRQRDSVSTLYGLKPGGVLVLEEVYKLLDQNITASHLAALPFSPF